MFYLTLLIIIVNLCILNILILDFINILTNLENNLYQMNIFIKNNAIKNQPFYENLNKFMNNNQIINNNEIINNNLCYLDCFKEIKKIINFYDNISQFKNIYHMIPIKIEKFEKNKCQILYINQPLLNNKYNKTNMFKDKRIFTFNYFNDNLCDWYISDMSISLWDYK